MQTSSSSSMPLNACSQVLSAAAKFPSVSGHLLPDPPVCRTLELREGRVPALFQE